MKGDKDPGYGSTSKVAPENALALLEVDTPGGVTTPGAVMAAPLMERYAGLSLG